MKEKLVITQYQIQTGKLRRSLRIAIVTDLHEHKPELLLSRIRSIRPDLILVAGDTLERHKEGVSEWNNTEMDACQGIKPHWGILGRMVKALDTIFGYLLGCFTASKNYRRGKNTSVNSRNAYKFLREAAGIAPVFMSVGNHEWYFLPEDYQVFEENGIILLDNRDIEAEINDLKIRIGGLSTRYDLKWLRSFSQKPGFKILLCHHPEYYKKYIKETALDHFDLIFSGHCHGGQWRIGKRGFYAPGQGLFPRYIYGMYPIRHGKLIVSAGVSNTASIPRFGNPCELVYCQIVNGKGVTNDHPKRTGV